MQRKSPQYRIAETPGSEAESLVRIGLLFNFLLPSSRLGPYSKYPQILFCPAQYSSLSGVFQVLIATSRTERAL